ncbi:MFS transporter [Solihabitans fulvus]|uniref:MFS transporter n=1 Tax=Solihabitans fulvus TaxID=1892852 RepID=A0A5B2XBJ8_9PSEU|nr:MFS transporter [Solihabitans fulvus]KAA2261098.1 MFS transporter [Solihabitans fulvus]
MSRSTDTEAGTGVLRTLRETSAPVRALLLGTLVNRSAAFLQVFLVLYLAHLGYSAGQAGLALGLHGAGGAVGGVVGGWLVDRIGARLTIAASSVVTGALTVVVLYVGNYQGILALVVLIGVGNQAFRPASAASFADHTSRGRYVMVFAMQRLAGNLGATAGPLLGALIVQFSFGALFWIEGVVTVTIAALALVVLPADRAAGRPPKTPKTVGTEAESPSPARASLFADWRFMLFLAAALLSSAVYVQQLSTLPLQVRALGLSTATYGVLIAINGAVVALFELPLTTVTQNWPARPTIMLHCALIGVGMGLYSVTGGVAGLVVATLVWSAGEILGAPTLFAYPAKITPDHQRGRYLGAFGAVIGAAFAVGPVLGTLGWHAFGPDVWRLCLLVSAAAVLAAFLGVRHESGPHDSPTGSTHD